MGDDSHVENTSNKFVSDAKWDPKILMVAMRAGDKYMNAGRLVMWPSSSARW